MSRYDNIDVTKWELVQIRIAPNMKKEIKAWCALHGLDLSTFTRLMYDFTLKGEREVPIDAPVLDKMDWIMTRLNQFFHKNNGNGRFSLRRI